jgi:hypothetical protein
MERGLPCEDRHPGPERSTVGWIIHFKNFSPAKCPKAFQ